MNGLENTQQLQSQLDQQVLLHRITNRIRQSLDLPGILTATVAEIRSFLGTDRIMIYEFSPDGSGEVVAESRFGDRLPSLLGLHFPADDIPAYTREMYCSLRQRTIVNVAGGTIGISHHLEETGTSSGIDYRTLDPCHQAYLTAMGVEASLVVPILLHPLNPVSSEKPKLWGLLVSHHAEPQPISESDIHLVQLLVDQLAIAIAQANLLSETQQQAQQEATINTVVSLLHERPTIELLAALEATVKALQGVGGRLYIQPNAPHSPEVFTWGKQPHPPAGIPSGILEEHPLWQHWLINGYGASSQANPTPNPALSPWVITDVYKEPQWRVLLRNFQSTPIRGILVLPIQYRQQLLGVLTIFRDEIDTETLWAGEFDPSVKQMMPRQSFEIWRESKQGQAQPWTEAELTLAKALIHQFAMAIQQYRLYQEVQCLNLNLEEQIDERTNQLKRALDFAKTLERITDQIRRTLDLKTTLSCLVREVRALLDTDRVVIYQLINQQAGEVVFEDRRDSIRSIVGMQTPEDCFPEDMVMLYRQGRMRAICDVYNENLALCHQEFLESLGVRANLIVPINQELKIWGLLIAHECTHPRNWETEELDILKQLADQAAIAIAQAELYEQSRRAAQNEQAKAEQLTHTLNELQKTQSQLIQTEKMLSLGRLVAGMAHEINNPINFIFGNLLYASEYTQNLLNLIQLYQRYYPYPTSEIVNYISTIELDFIAKDLPKILESMQSGADRIRQLVLSLRNFARLDQADLKFVDLHEGIESTLLLLQHRLNINSDAPEIQVKRHYGNLPPVECYASLLNQVFMNILSNAIDALAFKTQGSNQTFSTSEQTQPCLEIRTALRDEITALPKIVISIIDNGTGIPNALLPHIFDPFFTTKPVGQGTGLGLSISYQIIVEKHKGSLKCLSHWGLGTEFKIEIPLRQSLSDVTLNS
ncbi:Phytochrome-like protein cph2 [Planktothrix tepida]|uniref:histidine kinase n=2 Tax=Planktothrix TaxID=54304 RepID=A0A1J1LQZ0_9CYAN|nr:MULTISPECIES: GAF domain-containing protein [Planktothrix]CAD5934667.1 Phytochrome-like protein cph2 [Planktothrix pseudagardhii]CAD5975393.1 Phytochrome-like protein cph2 [Planktothrix tepida]CUR34284.1 Multi-sensor Signal Transduction Histidine Kinase [Planktothrix tepida PCC 9214]